MFDKLLERCLCENKRWTKEKANQFLEEIEPILFKAGYKARIVGSVAEKGWSDHDLDILLTPMRRDYNFEIIANRFPGDFTHEMETYEFHLDGHLVDLWFESKEK